jgi:hypothetical protein
MLYRKRRYRRDRPAKRKLFQKKFDQKQRSGVIDRRNGRGTTVSAQRLQLKVEPKKPELRIES